MADTLMCLHAGKGCRRVLILFSLMVFLTGCLKTGREPVRCIYDWGGGIRADTIKEDIEALEDVVKHTDDRELKMKTLLRLSYLYASTDNPEKDYRKAIERFDAYLKILPEGCRSYELLERRSLLEELTRLEETLSDLETKQKETRYARRNLRDCKEEKKRLLGKVEELKKMVKELKGTIERLKYLDLNLERKRKSYRGY